jgi:hypothetical protein
MLFPSSFPGVCPDGLDRVRYKATACRALRYGWARRPVPTAEEANLDTPKKSEIARDRRGFFCAIAAVLAVSRFGGVGFADAQLPSGRAPRVPNIKAETHTSFPSLKQINAGSPDIGYTDVGSANGLVAILLHDWPYDIIPMSI